MFISLIELLCGRFGKAEAYVEEVTALSKKYGLAYWTILARLWQGLVLAATDRNDEAVNLISSGLSGLAKSLTTLFRPLCLAWLARAHAACGRGTEAQNTVSEALNTVRKTGERWDEAEVYRTAGELALLLAQDVEASESHFLTSLAIARQQSAKSYELRAATSLARLWRIQDKRSQTHELLFPIVAWFNEGFELPDLIKAKTLLREL
jgi:predicted ATPase